MRMEFRKLDGEETFPHKLLAESFDPKPGELLQFAKNSLNGFYEGVERVFWPKPKHISRAPEEVRIVNDEGDVLAKYTVSDLAKDTKKYLVGQKPE